MSPPSGWVLKLKQIAHLFYCIAFAPIATLGAPQAAVCLIVLLFTLGSGPSRTSISLFVAAIASLDIDGGYASLAQGWRR